MLPTYQAVIDGDRIKWQDDAPPSTGPVRVHVTLLEPVSPTDAADRRRAMIAALEALAARNPFKDIDDPVAWQREIRQDRPLPGRED